MMGSVAQGIKTVIRRQGLTQKYVAKASFFTEQQFSDMLNGRKLILAEYMPRIANALGVTVSEIYDAGKDPSQKDAF